MTIHELALPVSERIKLLKQDASEKNVFGKASKIAKLLGTGRYMSHGKHYTYNMNGLKIWYDDYGPNLSITYADKHEVFFQQLHEVVRYRPDIDGWLTELESVYQELIKPKIDAEKLAVERSKEEEIMERWGIPITHVQKDGATK
jgi:hypothetical protein